MARSKTAAPDTGARRAAEEATAKAQAATVEAQEAQLAEKIARQNARFTALGEEMAPATTSAALGVTIK